MTIIQTRTGSTRLPGKVLLPLGGKPLFVRMAERVKQASLAGNIVIATTCAAEDDIIEQICLRESIECFRGHPVDLLDRHYQAAISSGADAIVKIPSDCPLIDAGVIDRVLTLFVECKGEFDYASNLHPATYPDGNDVEVFTIDTLKTAWLHARKGFEREHTTPFIWENPERFKLGNVHLETGVDYSMSHRWVLDYMEDYQVIRAVYDALSDNTPCFGIAEILAFLEKNPAIRKINEKYTGVNWYRNHLSELRTIKPEQTKLQGAI